MTSMAHIQPWIRSKAFIPWRGIKHALPSPVHEQRMLATIALPDLLHEAELIEILPDKKGRKDITAVYKVKAPMTIKGEPHNAYMVVRETADGRRYYDHRVFKIEKEKSTHQASR